MATITSVINQLTQRIIRGNTAGTSDQLLFTPTTAGVLRVGIKKDTEDYTEGVDFTIVNSSISWALVGNEPSPGQPYYITYKYNPTQFLKDFDTIVSELSVDFNTLLPRLDISKSSARDLFVNVIARQFADQYNGLEHIYNIQSLANVDEMTDDELDVIGVNYSKPRLPATKSAGTAKFFMNIARGFDVIIPAGTRIGTQSSLTNNQQITFLTTESKTVTASNLFVFVPIEAEVAGVVGNVGSETIKILVDTVDVDGVVNSVATAGGQDQEANEDYAKRLIDVFKGRNIATVNGIRSFVESQTNVIDTYIADVGDPVMVRDNGLGGKVDIYIQAESGFSTQLTDEYTYSGSDHTFIKQPVLSITQVLINDVPLAPANYSLVKDAGILKNSTRSTDYLNITAGVAPGDNVKVTYSYNELFNIVQGLLDSDTYGVAGIDRLVRGAEETFIDVTGSVQIDTGFVFADVQNDIIDQITAYIEAKEIGSSIVYGDIINIIHDTDGVIDLIPLSKLSRSTEHTAQTVDLRGNEFPRAGSIVINQIL